MEGRLARAPRDRAHVRLVSDRDRKRPGSRATDVLSRQSSTFDDRVTFIPGLAQHDLWDAMAQADALLLPSLRDDAPFVVAEAQAVGLPVVAFDQGRPAGVRPASRDPPF